MKQVFFLNHLKYWTIDKILFIEIWTLDGVQMGINF